MFLVVTRNFPPDLGGIQSLMGGLSETLLNHGPVKVFTYEYSNSNNYDKKSSANIERIKGIKIFKKYRKANLVNDFINKNPNIRALIVDHWKSLELIKTENINKIKTFCLIHSKEINHDKGTNLNKRVLKVLNNVDHIVSNSKYTKDLAINLGVIANKISVINPGIDPVKNLDETSLKDAEKLLKGKKTRLITVSRYDKRKNHEKVIMALRNLKELYPDIIYTCIGYGEEEENIKKLVKELNLDSHVLFLKDISQNFKNALIAKSNIFIMPSIIHKKSVEGFGIAFVEAAQYGIPSIGGKDGGASDAIIHNKTGLICDGNNLDEIYSSINELINNNKFLEFGKNAKEHANIFLWDKIINSYKKILQ